MNEERSQSQQEGLDKLSNEMSNKFEELDLTLGQVQRFLLSCAISAVQMEEIYIVSAIDDCINELFTFRKQIVYDEKK